MTSPIFRTLDVEVTGGTLHAAVWAPADDAVGTVLAIHGITSNHRAWPWLVQALPGWQVVAPDLRGRGASNQLPSPFGMATHADDLAALLTATGDGPVTVVGHSMGGFVALVLAHRHPELVDRLVLVDGGLPVQLSVPEGMTPEQVAKLTPEELVTLVIGPGAQRLRMEFPSVEVYLAFWRQHPAFAEAWSDEVAAYFAHDLQGEAPHLRPATRVEAAVGDTADVLSGTDLPAALENLSHPASFLRAERGILNEPTGLYDPAWVAEWAEKLPGLATDLVTGVNHYTIIMSDEGCQRVAQAITA